MLKTKNLLIVLVLTVLLALTACASEGSEKNTDNQSNEETNSEKADSESEEDNAESEEKEILTGKLELDKSEGRIGDEVHLSAEELEPNEPVKVVYADMEGSFDINKENNYSFNSVLYDEVEKELAEGTADEAGSWSGTVTIPDGFGDDHDIIIYQNDKKVAKANFFVETVFSISPESGPIGTEIEITGEGLSWKMYGSVWHLNYDNAYTGMFTAVSTNGEAKGVVRAAGGIGDHMLTIESGASGAPYISRDSSAINYIHTQNFTFKVTDDEPETDLVYVEEPPSPALGGIQMPDAENKKDVQISLDKEEGIVDEAIEMTGSGLPKNADVTLEWHTMVGNRVTPEGFSPKVSELGTVKTDENGKFIFPFEVPDDLGGLPHLIDVKVDEEIYGQTYLQILPSVESITPSEGPPGTEFTVVIKGSGWTEYDNAMGVTYDNAYVGYVCGFNSQGTVTFPLVASGDSGYHVLDIYPSIYQGKVQIPDIYRKPQLTYRDDHPGTGIPAIRTFFKVTEE